MAVSGTFRYSGKGRYFQVLDKKRPSKQGFVSVSRVNNLIKKFGLTVQKSDILIIHLNHISVCSVLFCIHIS